MWKCILCLFSFALLFLLLATPGLAQEPAPPNPELVLERANAALNRANEVSTLAAATIELVRNTAWFFGIIVAVATVVLGLYGFSTQRGFQESLREYRTQLDQARTAYQESLSDYHREQENVRALRADMAAKVQEIESIRQELSQIKASVTEEFTAAKQAVALLAMGNRLFGAGKRAQAIEAYEEARRLQPDDAEINYRLGRAYSNAGRYEDAITVFEKALNAKPDYPEVNMELGLAYRRHADQAETAEERAAEYRLAERYLKRAIELRPDYEDALGALGGLYRRQGQYPKSLEMYRRARTVDPNSSYAVNNVASLAWYLGEVELARQAFQDVERVASERIQAGTAEGFWNYYDRALARLVLSQSDETLKEKARQDHLTAIGRTPEVDNFSSVLDNLRFLKRAETPIPGLDEFIALIEDKIEMQERVVM